MWRGCYSICNLRYKTLNEISVELHNGCRYNYHFINNELLKEFEGQFQFLGKNTKKYVTVSLPIKKERDNGKTITYKLEFIDSFKFMATALWELVNNLSKIYS